MEHRTVFLTALLVLLLLVGCTGSNVDQDKLNGQINVFGVKLFSNVDYKSINGVTATEEPCLYGYERNFDALDVIVGYGFDKNTRKITTLNAKTSLFGIKPDTLFEEGKAKIIEAGFKEYEPPYIFRAYGYSLKFLVDSDKIKGLTLEPIE